MSTTTKWVPRKPRIPQPIMKDCDHCGGDGEVQVHCEDCGNELDDASLAPGYDELCVECKANRDEDKAEADECKRQTSPSESDEP